MNTRSPHSIFGFPRKERAQFLRHYLKSVFIDCTFIHIDSKKLTEASIQDLLGPDFEKIENPKKGHLKIRFANNFPSQGIDIETNTHSIGFKSKTCTISISTYYVRVDFAGKEYTNFDSSLTLSKLIQIINHLEIKEIKTLNIRKINALEVTTSASFDLEQAHNWFFKQEWNGNLPSEDYIDRYISTFGYRKENYNALVHYGVQRNPQVFDKARVILDIQAGALNAKVDEKLTKELSALNDEIFFIFNWALSDRFIKLLETNQ